MQCVSIMILKIKKKKGRLVVVHLCRRLLLVLPWNPSLLGPTILYVYRNRLVSETGTFYLTLVKRLQRELTLLYRHCYKRNKCLVVEF